MRIAFLFILIFLVSLPPVGSGLLNYIKKDEQQNGVIIKSIDPLLKIVYDSDFSGLEETSEYDLARGEKFYLQFVIWSRSKVTCLKVQQIGGVKGIDLLSKEQVGFVSLKEKGILIKDRINTAINKYPDPLQPMPEDLTVQSSQVVDLWFSLKVSNYLNKGAYKIKVKFTGTEANGKKIEINKTITINVFSATLNNSLSPFFSNWLFIDIPTLGPDLKKMRFLNNNREVVPFSNQYWDNVRGIAKFMVGSHQNSIIVSPQRLARYSYNRNNQLEIDFSRFDSMINIFTTAGFKGRIEGWHITSRSGGWESDFEIHYIVKGKNGEPEFKTAEVSNNKDAEDFYRTYLPALVKHLKEKGLERNYYQHVGDEPTDQNAASYLKILSLLKKISPDLKTIEAIQTLKVVNNLDISVPELDFLNVHWNAFSQLISKGREVWFYTAFLPQGTYANRFIEQPAIYHELLFWIASKYGVKGILNWGFNFWEDEDVYNNLGKKSGSYILPAGDSWLVYPSKSKLYPSIRLRIMEDGIEDYILLEMLKLKDTVLADKILKSVVFNFDSYETNIKKFRVIRKQILQYL